MYELLCVAAKPLCVHVYVYVIDLCRFAKAFRLLPPHACQCVVAASNGFIFDDLQSSHMLRYDDALEFSTYDVNRNVSI